MRKGKAQAALEYLMGYGWALVVIIVVVATLILMTSSDFNGAGTGGGFQSNIVLVNAGYPRHPTDPLEMFFVNNSGRDLTLQSVVVKLDGSAVSGPVSFEDSSAMPFLFRAGEKRKVSFVPDAGWPAGDNQLQVELNATDLDGFSKNSSGILVFRV